MPTKYDKEAADRLAESIAADPHTHLLADAIADLIDLRTGFDRAENRACLLVDVLGRGMGSRKAAAEHLTVPGKWQRILRISTEMDGGATLPWSPPTENRVRQWRRRFLPDRYRPDHKTVPDMLRAIQATVTELGARRAVQLGQFPVGVDPDFTGPDWAHMLIGDGTWVKKFSNVETVIDPELGEVHRHSRATAKPRQQQAAQSLTKHEKKVTGVLHTVLLTESKVGWVFLGGDQTFGGESESALSLVEQVTALLGERVHTLCYDRGYTGWLVDWSMAHLGVPVISTQNPKTSQEKDPELKQHTLDAKKALAGLLPAKDPRLAKLTPVRAQRALQAAANAEQMREHRDVLGLPAGIGRPLGTCYYLTTGDNVEKVISRYYKYKTIDHPRADGSMCEHHMYVDDGALWEAVQQGHEWVKAQRPRSHAYRVRDSDTGAWTRVMDWELDCAETGDVLREQSTWQPELLRGKPDKHRSRTSEERALEAMQPLPRCDAAFATAYGRRNESEAWFAWYKSTLRRGDSAASLSLDHQLLDLLFAGMVTNARALRRARLTGLVAPDTAAA